MPTAPTPTKALLANLNRAEVSELVLLSGARAAIRVGSANRDLDDHAWSSDEILQVLVAAGGSRHVDELGPKLSQWRTRVEGVGTVNVSAYQRANRLEARFSAREAPAP